MNSKLTLDRVAEDIKTKSGGRLSKQKKFEGTGDEYFISGVTEAMLIEMGFEFKGHTHYGNAPYYIKDNILAYFDDVILHIMEETYSAI